jgi:hypothetical protein
LIPKSKTTRKKPQVSNRWDTESFKRAPDLGETPVTDPIKDKETQSAKDSKLGTKKQASHK